jgi:hypothetical protein
MELEAIVGTKIVFDCPDCAAPPDRLIDLQTVPAHLAEAAL